MTESLTPSSNIPIINYINSFSELRTDNGPFTEIEKYIKLAHRSTIKSKSFMAKAGKDWKYIMRPSVSLFLFEGLNIVENIAPVGNINRPGDVHKKEYICVHETGDWAYNAKKWSQIVHRAAFDSGAPYKCSFQYVVGNDGIYHNIPDNETAYHAGDGHTIESLFKEYPSGVYKKSSNEEYLDKSINQNHIDVEISKDGYYMINHEKSKIKAPRNSTDHSILKTKDINDLGIFVRYNEKDNQYYIGKTWYSETFEKIGNYGGNLNSIGIESCVNTNSDIYLTWQRLAKLVAHLMYKNKLDISRVKQHHYFSGKNCPQTIRTQHYWEFFLSLVKVEYNMIKFINAGYKIKFESMNKEYLADNGRVLKTPKSGKIEVEYKVKIEFQGKSHEFKLKSMIDAFKEK